MGSDGEISNKRRRFNNPDFQIPRKCSSDDLQEDDNDFLALSLSSFCSGTPARACTISPVPHHHVTPPPPPSAESSPSLSLKLSQPHHTLTVNGENLLYSAPTRILPYRYYQEDDPTNGAAASRPPPIPPAPIDLSHLSLQLSPPHHPLFVKGENPPSISDPNVAILSSCYQEDGLSNGAAALRPPPPPLTSLDLPPPFASSSSSLAMQFSPFHHHLSVTGGKPSFSSVTKPHPCHQEVGPSSGTVASKPPRGRRNPSQTPREGKGDTVPAPFPWATNHRATVHTLSYIISKQIFSIPGEVQCKRCERKYEIEFDLQQKFTEIATFVIENKATMHDRAPGSWLNPTLPTCKFCEQENSAKPMISDKKKSINWLFLLLGQMLGCCTLDQLKYFCKHTKNHRTGAKDRVLYLTYLGLCKQLDPSGPFDYR